MSGRLVIVVIVVVVALAMAVVGLMAVLGRLDLSLAQRSVRATTSTAERRGALRQIRSGQASAPGQVAPVRAVATALASQGGPSLTYTGVTLTSVALAFGPYPPWFLVLAGLAAGGNAVVAVMLIKGYRRGRRFLGAHPDVDEASR